ncbi:MAG: four helix bundle protein [FCB group bacterium]|nr:four helix bundle protein [FCB group bacterium]
MSVGFENLDVWQRSVALSAKIYKYFKDSKDYGFKDQITRSSLSIPSNISEGYERESAKEKKYFYTIAKGSVAELRTQIFIGMKIEYIDKENGKEWIQESRELSAMIVGLINSIRTTRP